MSDAMMTDTGVNRPVRGVGIVCSSRIAVT